MTSCRDSLVVVVVMGVDYGSERLPHSLEPWSFLQGSVESRNHRPTTITSIDNYPRAHVELQSTSTRLDPNPIVIMNNR